MRKNPNFFKQGGPAIHQENFVVGAEVVPKQPPPMPF